MPLHFWIENHKPLGLLDLWWLLEIAYYDYRRSFGDNFDDFIELEIYIRDGVTDID